MKRSTPIGAAVAACLFAIGMSAPAAAATEDGQFAVELPGQASCARVMKAKESDPAEYARFLGFVEGYISAANRYEPNTFDLTPWHTSQAYTLILSNHCADHPEELLGLTVQRLVGAMKPLRLATFSELEKIENEGRRAEVYGTILKRAQQQLSQMGLYSGDADGKFSSEMKAALIAFQGRSGLDETGLPDTATLWSLLNP